MKKFAQTNEQIERMGIIARALPGFTSYEVRELCRCERMLARWRLRELYADERGCIVIRDENGKPWRTRIAVEQDGLEPEQRIPVDDRARSALIRAEAIAAGHGCTIAHTVENRVSFLWIVRACDEVHGSPGVPVSCDTD